MDIAIAILSVIGGLVLLTFGGDKLVDGAITLGRHFKLSDVFIGIVIVGFGTSLPEMMAGVVAAKQESAALVLGNMIGSNIANIGLVLATGLLLIKAHQKKVKSMALDYTLMLLASVIFAFLLYTGREVSAVEGSIMMALLFVLLSGSYLYAVKTHVEAPLEYDEDEIPLVKAFTFVFLGIVGLYIGAELLVSGAIFIASKMGISERVIGLTMVAIGTSLPELAATFAAARKSGLGLVLGNVCGSNMFNLLAGVGLAATVYPLEAVDVVLDVSIMGFFSLAMMMLFFIKDRHLHIAGTLFLVGYAGYLSFLGAG
jgi:cation:H+ antiporter